MNENQSPMTATGIALLNYGWLLDETHTDICGNLTTDDPRARRIAAENDIVKLLESDKEAKTFFTFTGDKLAEPIEAAIIAYVVYRVIATECGVPSLAMTADIVSVKDMAKVVLARRTAYNLVRKGSLKWHDGCSASFNGGLSPSRRLVNFVVGKGAPAVFNASLLAKVAANPGMENEQDSIDDDSQPVEKQESNLSLNLNLSPSNMFHRITNHVTGLDPLVKTFVSRLALHLKRAELIQAKNPAATDTPNEVLLFCGPSGSGKTYLAEMAGKYCGIPFGASDLTGVTEDGWQGMCVSDVVAPLIAAAGGNTRKARTGIIFLDEVDSRRSSPAAARDISGAGVQKSLLKLIEGTDFQVGGRRGGGFDPIIKFNSRGTFFILAGAFVGLEDILAKQGVHSSMGFAVPSSSNDRERDLHSALESFGMLPELLNRLTGIFMFPTPTVEQLVKIAKGSVITSYSRLLTSSGLELHVTDAGVLLMAEWAAETKTYARGLKSIMSRLVEEAVFNDAKGKVTFGAKEVRQAITGGVQ